MENTKRRNILIASISAGCVIVIAIIIGIVCSRNKSVIPNIDTETQAATEVVMETETEDYSELFANLAEYRSFIEDFDIEAEENMEEVLNDKLESINTIFREVQDSEQEYTVNEEVYAEYTEIKTLYQNNIDDINNRLEEIVAAKEEAAAAKAVEQKAAEQKAAEQAQAQTETASQPAVETPAEPTPSAPVYTASHEEGYTWRKYTQGTLPESEYSDHWISGYYDYVWSEANQCWYQNGGNIMGLGTLPQSVWTGPASKVTSPPNFNGTYDGETWGDTIFVWHN